MIQIKQKNERLAIYINGKLDAQGFLTEADALHAIWQENGTNPEHFYIVKDGRVCCDATPFNKRKDLDIIAS